MLEQIFSSWRAGHLEDVLEWFAEDAIWHFSASTKPPAVGRAEIREFLINYAAITETSRLRLLRQADCGDVVHFEAVEEFTTTGGHLVAVPYAGVVSMRSGKIADWRDYFDRALVDDQVTGKRSLPDFAQPLLEAPKAMPAAPQDGGRFGDVILSSIERFGSRTAFIEGDTHTTYDDLGDRIRKAIETLEGLGLQEGDTVAQIAGNSVNLYAVMAAAYIRNFRSLTLHPMGGFDDHQFILADAEAKILICDRAYSERASALSGGDIRLFCHDEVPELRPFWQEPGLATDRPYVRGTTNSIVRLAYTGGTTGRPKGVMLSNRALVANTMMALGTIPWPSDLRYLCCAPISHGAGSIVVPVLARGGTIILQKGFEPKAFCDALEKCGASLTWLVPTMVMKLLEYLEHHPCDTSCLEALIWSGAPMASKHIAAALERFGPILVQCYGQTEAPNTILHLSGEEQRDNPTATGRPFPGIDIALLDDDNQAVPEGLPGEICVRGPLVMTGYLKLPGATEEVFSGGWLHTGDLARVDDRGLYHIVDRKKDMIISGGFNVFPKEVEEILLLQPGISHACVFGIPDEKWGEIVAAAVVPLADAQLDMSALAAAVKRSKGPVQTPKRIEAIAAIPLTGLGKPDKKALAAMFVEQRRREAIAS